MNKLKKKYSSEKVNDSIENNIDTNDDNTFKEKMSDFNSDKVLNNEKIIFDIPVNITIELGKSKIKIKELLNFSKGSTFFLNKHKEDPLKIFANGKLVALGEIIMSENTYGVRIISIKNSLNTMN
ncbi:flagellar motor switch protein FliN [Buchnera aphidicola]|uniref:Flagellar motor switch protein FliN n=1 Tax=Buchnera aphidicola (Aphis nerii) TaxID=1241835 RepID=A0A4D6XVJ5_9GAMM|nr:flagellar motor switch protein FliN [Buchnera aphidicola]QCI18644.1 flagellar motor switch protein FliN [Buchnera aphidicola (Aphis nerii)]